ncbi:MAG: hypothetical protein K8R48_00830 [Alphaproteobacteria bacterium]|nr:hypothetical protein [Alphaproteobacteria bacterium]
MSAWKIPLFALTLVTFIGAAAYAEDIPPPGYPAQGEGITLQTPAMSAQDILAPDSTPAAPEAAPAPAMPAPEAAPAPAPAAAPEAAPAPEKKAEIAPPKKAVHKKIKDMTPEERSEMQRELMAWFAALPLEKQAAIKDQSTAKKWKPKKAVAPAPAPAAAPAVEAAPAPAPAPDMGQMPMPAPMPMEQMPMPMPMPTPAPAPAPGQ